MGVVNRIYVDFSVRDPEGRFYTAQLDRFNAPIDLGDRFIGTDLDEFEVECEILAIDYRAGQVYHRPVRPADVPGTYETPPQPGAPGRYRTIEAGGVTVPTIIPAAAFP